MTAEDARMSRALDDLPRYIAGLDYEQHKTVSDLVGLVQHELDLYAGDGGGYITTGYRLRQCREYVDEWGDE